MSFGRNPRVAKAEAAEQKANTARDASARELAWREAARQWDRAADRETDDKRRATYTEKAEMARAQADGTHDPQSQDAASTDQRPKPKPPSVLN